MFKYQLMTAMLTVAINLPVLATGARADDTDAVPTSHWRALAAGMTEGSTSYVDVAAGFGNNRAAAEAQALNTCNSNLGGQCHIHTSYNHGCAYMTVGKNSDGQVGWGYGLTAQQAYDNCSARNLTCHTHTTGGCAD